MTALQNLLIITAVSIFLSGAVASFITWLYLMLDVEVPDGVTEFLKQIYVPLILALEMTIMTIYLFVKG